MAFVTIFGNLNRSGMWHPRRRSFAISVIGNINLDLRHVELPEGDVVIHAIAPVGDVKVVAPEGVEIDIEGFTLFGHKREAASTSPSGLTRVVRLRAYSIFGDVTAGPA